MPDKLNALISGSSHWDDAAFINLIVRGLAASEKEVTIIEGGDKGADTLAKRAAYKYKLPVKTFPAEWDVYGKAAGPLRNAEAIKSGQPDLVIAFSDDLSGSPGTRDMIRQAKEAGVPVYLVSRP